MFQTGDLFFCILSVPHLGGIPVPYKTSLAKHMVLRVSKNLPRPFA